MSVLDVLTRLKWSKTAEKWNKNEIIMNQQKIKMAEDYKHDDAGGKQHWANEK